MQLVVILISTYNGEKYIREQLLSLIEQEGVLIKIVVRDDGSEDSTVEIIRELQEKYDIDLIAGDNMGYASSFMMLVHLAASYKADYYAFCDQDDVWEHNKLVIAVTKLLPHIGEPALYLSQAKIVDESLNLIDSSFHKRKVELGAVLEHNYAIGCTMVFNEKLRNILDISITDMCLTCGHDSWVFLVALAIDAFVYFDLEGYVLYRQHGKNVSGKIVTINQAIKAIMKILVKWKNARSESAYKILKSYKYIIQDENRTLLEVASDYMNGIREKKMLIADKHFNSDYKFVDVLFRISVILNLF